MAYIGGKILAFSVKNMFERIKKWIQHGKRGVLSALLWIAQNATSIDLSALTQVMTTLIYAILPLLVIVMIFKVFGNVVKSLGDIF
jgi:hypothetical protein